MLALLQRLAVGVENLTNEVRRVDNHVAPQPGDLVGTAYVARQLGCTNVWAAELARKGEIPGHCILPGTGKGKVWRFHRRQIDEWLAKRQ